MGNRQAIKNLSILTIIFVLGGILFLKILFKFGDYYINNYGYNVTLGESQTKHGNTIIEGLFKLKKVKYRKNDEGNLQVRKVDIEQFKNVLTLSHNYNNYAIVSEKELQEIVSELKKEDIKYATIQHTDNDDIFIIWEQGLF